MSRKNPFKNKTNNNNMKNASEKDPIRDPLDVCSLLTENTRKAEITPDGQLQIKKAKPQGKPSVELMKQRVWGNESYQAIWNRRLALESREMARQFPHFQLRQSEQILQQHNWTIAEPGETFWLGSLSTYSGATYSVAIVYPSDYPFGEIKSYVLDPYIPVTDHRFVDGHLCLYDHDGDGEGYESGKSTAVTIIAWTAAWLHAYEIWRITGHWPTLEETS